MADNYAEIQIKGETVGLKFGVQVLREWYNKSIVINFNSADVPDLNEIGFAFLFFYAYKYNCLVKDIPPKYTVEDFSDYIDETFFDSELCNKRQKIQEDWLQTDIGQKFSQAGKIKFN